MTYASVCSGIEAATVAWHPLGFAPVWFSQYDPEHPTNDFASEVLAHHYPETPNLGDMTKLRDDEYYRKSNFELLVGGTPCQAFSIAGLRAGLADDRSNLALEYIRILGEKQPTWFLWENVPGVLTSNGGADFASILSGFTGTDVPSQKFTKEGIIQGEFYSVAWRVFDSRYFGVPQRRRRIFVVGHLGNDWRPPVAVLFEQDSLWRDFTPGGAKRKRTTGGTKGSTGAGRDWPSDTASCLNRSLGVKQGLENQHINEGAPLFVPMSYALQGNMIGRKPENGPQGSGVSEETSFTLTKCDVHAVAYAIQGNVIDRNSGQNGLGISEEETPTLTKSDRHGVSYTLSGFAQYQEGVGTLKKNGGDLGGGSETVLVQPISFGWQNSPSQGDSVSLDVTPTLDKSKTPAVCYRTLVRRLTPMEPLQYRTLVRRLTPMECLRLQGFPDDYLDIPGASDTRKYQVIGNSMTVQVMRWIGRRIQLTDKILKEWLSAI